MQLALAKLLPYGRRGLKTNRETRSIATGKRASLGQCMMANQIFSVRVASVEDMKVPTRLMIMED